MPSPHTAPVVVAENQFTVENADVPGWPLLVATTITGRATVCSFGMSPPAAEVAGAEVVRQFRERWGRADFAVASAAFRFDPHAQFEPDPESSSLALA